MKPVAAATVTQRHSSDADTEETFGIDLTAQKKQTEKTNGIKAVSFRSLFRFASWFDMFLMSIGVLCAFANGGSISAFTIILGDVFNVLNTPNPLAAQVVALRFFYIAAGAFVVSFLQVAVFTATAERMTIRLRQQYLDSILKQDITFFDYNGSGVLVSQLAENSLLFRDAMGEKFGSLFQFGAMFVSGLIVGFVYLWQLALVIIAFMPLLAAAGMCMGKAIVFLTSGQLELYASAGAIADESLRWIRMITAFGLQKDRLKAYDVQLALAEKKAISASISMGVGFGTVFCIVFGTYSVAFYCAAVFLTDSRISAANQFPPALPATLPFCVVGAQVPTNCSTQVGAVFFKTAVDICSCQYCQCGCYSPPAPILPGIYTFKSSCITGGDVILCFFAVLIASFSLGQAAPSISALVNAMSALSALYEVIDRKPLIDADAPGGLILDNIRGDIEFKNVAFAYPTRLDATIFKDLNFKIPANKRVALVGESGCGKSTVIGLLQRFYDPAAGMVLLDGIDIKNINLKFLRSKMGLVSQDPILFEQTVLENIRFGRPDATDDEVIEAAKTANIHNEILGFPDQYDTFITQNLVSGGQAQRLQIARAILRNPQILLLDEATSALDNKSEAIVNAALDKLIADKSTNRTTVLIAHRLSSIIQSDIIYVFNGGVVAEQGSHSTLVEIENGWYAALFKLANGGKAQHAYVNNINIVPQVNKQSDVEKVLDVALIKKFDAATSMVIPIVNDSLNEKLKSYSLRESWQFTKEDKLLYLPAIVAAVANGVVFPIYALLLSRFMATFYMINYQDVLFNASMYSLAFFGLALGVGLANVIQHWLFGVIGSRLTTRVRHDMFRHMLSFEIGYFDVKDNSVGVLTSKLGADAGNVRGAIADRASIAFQNGSTLIAGFVIAFLGSWLLALICLSLFPFMILAGAIQFAIFSGIAGQDQKALERAGQTLSESVHGIRTVTAFAMSPGIKQVYFDQLKGPLQASTKKGVIMGLVFGLSQSVMFIVFGICLYAGAQFIADGRITFEQLNQSIFGLLMSAMALGQTSMLAASVAQGSAAVNSVMRILDRPSKIDPFDETGIKPSNILGDVTFENIDFEYPTRPGIIVLQNFNLTVKRGQTVAFVGSSGAGKSTIVGMIERFYDPVAGKVTIDGHDLREYNVQFLRSFEGLVSQNPVLVRGTIMENVRAGSPDGSATDEEVMEACKLANAHEFISRLPDGYQTPIIGNSSLSGGQKQRVVIAKVLVRNPKLLILDEATSALDEESQQIVQQALDDLLKKSTRTTFIVAHRLSTIRNAAMIVVLQQGTIVETGTYDELVAKNGAFASLLKAQEKKDKI